MSDDEEIDAAGEEAEPPKKSKKKKSKNDEDGDGADSPKKTKKKKDKEKDKSKEGKDKKKKKKEKKDGNASSDDEKQLIGDEEEESAELSVEDAGLSSPTGNKGNVSISDLVSPSKAKKYSADYFESILNDVREKCDKKIKIKEADRDKFLEACSAFYDAWYGKFENEQWLHQLLENKGSQAEIDEAQSYVDQSNKALPKLKTKCIKAALKVFDKLDQDKMDTLEDKLVKGAIIAQAGAEELAKFSAEGRENEKLVKRLFGDAELMRDMLRFGGPMKYKYGNAMKIYAECVDNMGNIDKKLEKINKKIALACALELAAPTREFDSAVEIDAIARYKHFEEAHRNGELDPAFPHFSVWEMRQIINCDAPNDQMKWVRDMVTNYVPHITFITDQKLRYTYILQSDVRVRKPTWTASPRTYQMILSGGGNQSINSWFGRFILKSFGLPAWGAKERKFEGYIRWTPDGWEPMNGTTWETCSWQDKTGEDFKIEIEARNKAPPQEYWKKLVMLQALADVVDGDPNSVPAYEKEVLHPERLWRSLSIVSMALLFQTEPEVKRTFERKGRSVVKTRNEKYLELYELDKPDAEISVEDGVVTFPAGRHGFSSGNIMVIDSYGGGKQLNFLADGIVEYEIPDDAPTKKYKVTLEVCTVSAKQTPLSLKANDSDTAVIKINIPYTVGKWSTTDAVELDAEPGSVLRFSRPNGSLGLAIKKIILA